MTSQTRYTTQVLIIGSGIAGATCALRVAAQGHQVILINAGETLGDGNTAYAQGGIVYTGPDDSPALLERDVLTAGWKHNYNSAVRHLARTGPETVRSVLIDRLQIPFAKKSPTEFDLTREGGHSTYRVLYCADYTGRAIMEGLAEAVKKDPNIRVLHSRTAVDLITSMHHTCKMTFRYQRVNKCLGAYVYNDANKTVETILADYTVLATGGVGRIFLHSTNSECCVGSALAMAHRAGVNLMNVEYVQFHPTTLFYRSKRRFLITEAMRGEGAHLLNNRGERFMPKYDSRAELAPRDVVSRAIVDELHKTGEDCAYLDCRAIPHDIPTRFPTIYKRCLEIGLDITKEPIPVVPAAHYHCGGILCDVNGRTNLERLFAVGECSCTGLHGANRLASTSLLEGLVWGDKAGSYIGSKLSQRASVDKRLFASIPDWVHPGEAHNEDPALIAQDWATIRSTMWNYAGITRTEQRLKRASADLGSLIEHLSQFYKRTPLSKPIVDLFHGCYAAHIVTFSALRNKQSVGCHYLQED